MRSHRCTRLKRAPKFTIHYTNFHASLSLDVVSI